MEITNFTLIAGSAPKLRLFMQPQESIVNWTTQFTIFDPISKAVIAQVNGTPADITEVPNSTALGVFDVPLSSALTGTTLKAGKTYDWAFWRINAGSEDPLGSGEVFVKKIPK